MTDGGLYYSSRGESIKKFNVKDGYGIVKLRKFGISVGIISGRVSAIVQRRAEELGITELHQNMHDKLGVYNKIKKKHGLQDVEIAYIGDDVPDLEVLRRVGFSAAPADAVLGVRKAVHYVSKHEGGDGAVRDVIDIILSAQS
jgi:3-deoxy-D-manno-octulosonate 8-phosphate phosphatase (KDO 8-P phosphatase)